MISNRNLRADKLSRKKKSARAKVLISHQGCIPIYRESFFIELSKIRPCRYIVFYGDPPTGTNYIASKGPFSFETRFIRNREVFIAGKPLIWQPTFLKFIKEYDAAVLGEEIKYVSHFAIIIVSRILRRPVMLWGFGYRRNDRDQGAERPIRRMMHWLAGKVRGLLLKMVDGYLVYTDSGIEPLLQAGMERQFIQPVYNTVDIEKEKKLKEQVQNLEITDIYRHFGLSDGIPVLLYFGRFLPSKHVDRLIAYAKHRTRNEMPVALVIFGSGQERDNLVAMAEGASNIVFRSPDDLELAQALRLASAVVIPGFVGLAVTHAFAHGVPMITRENQGHSPEVDYLEHGNNGLMLGEDDNAFFEGLDRFLTNPRLQEELRSGAEQAAAKLSIRQTATAFDTLVTRILEHKNKAISPA